MARNPQLKKPGLPIFTNEFKTTGLENVIVLKKVHWKP